MVINFLGTGTSQGVPVITCQCEVCKSLDFRDKRLRTSIHLQHQDLSLVIDAGPDFRQQMLRENIPHLQAILLTHEHKDHTAGLDDIRAYNFSQGTDMPIYGLERVLEQLKTEFAYVFKQNNYPGLPKMLLNPIEKNSFSIGHLTIEPLEVMHHKLPILGYRIGNFAYITDTNYISDQTMDKLQGLDVLVLNALQQDPHISHFTLEEALAWIKKIAPKQAYLTHMSHKMGRHAEVSKLLPENVKMAYDGLKVTMN
jgi:phosphoribosyl 1,2-cyclic phosphate phosphodiesterase